MDRHVRPTVANDTAAATLVRVLTDRNETVATAESLTGGLLAATIVDVPGASVVLRGGLVVYATDLKATLAGVPADLLRARGPVDPDVAIALARGARRRCGATWGVSTTGVAGPTPQDGNPVGTVYVAVSGPPTAGDPANGPESDGDSDEVVALRLDGDRPAIRRAAVGAALAMLVARIDASIRVE
jgi:nicotinamide-nucleotide amidase